jgi:hypothetical protein
MQLVLSTNYLNTYLHQDYNILYSEWTESASKISREEFKQHIVDFLERIKKYKVRGFLTNSQKGHFTMDVGVQEWHDKEIAPHYIANGLKKIGFVLPEKDFFAAISLQQTFDETHAQQLQTKFFNTVEDAMNWIKD